MCVPESDLEPAHQDAQLPVRARLKAGNEAFRIGGGTLHGVCGPDAELDFGDRIAGPP